MKKYEKGMTLIEVLISLVLLTAISSIVIKSCVLLNRMHNLHTSDHITKSVNLMEEFKGNKELKKEIEISKYNNMILITIKGKEVLYRLEGNHSLFKEEIHEEYTGDM
ncbi:MAG: type II secretion system GspH family protein [Anaeromicrobium sp.]|jgi:prepilin-type N-terminal cleavage/methylation domain-containing protein|uniref:type IV pilus modification PilV family protein n=1 Tax=Anaeromicrobium sp. TaxID=1929132 RepID=UPI0025E5E820|nr:type II secretion system protein [Anaeromicrobium sp.]MCT4596160.1 type II secretion system GspH family protein [Anaeromicrobium sp.]